MRDLASVDLAGVIGGIRAATIKNVAGNLLYAGALVLGVKGITETLPGQRNWRGRQAQ